MGQLEKCLLNLCMIRISSVRGDVQVFYATIINHQGEIKVMDEVNLQTLWSVSGDMTGG